MIVDDDETALGVRQFEEVAFHGPKVAVTRSLLIELIAAPEF